MDETSIIAFPAVLEATSEVNLLKYLLIRIIYQLNELIICPTLNEVKLIYLALEKCSQLSSVLQSLELENKIVLFDEDFKMISEPLDEVLRLLYLRGIIASEQFMHQKRYYVTMDLGEDISISQIDQEVFFYCWMMRRYIVRRTGNSWTKVSCTPVDIEPVNINDLFNPFTIKYKQGVVDFLMDISACLPQLIRTSRKSKYNRRNKRP